MKFVLLLVAALLLTHCAQTPGTPTRGPTRAPVSKELAIQFALEALHMDSSYGKLVGEPTVVRGQVMSVAEAYMRVNGKAVPADSPLARRSNNQVWLVATRGEWILHIPGGHGDPLSRTPTILSKDITVPDLWNAILLDAATGEVFDQGGINAAQLPQVETLPSLLSIP